MIVKVRTVVLGVCPRVQRETLTNPHFNSGRHTLQTPD